MGTRPLRTRADFLSASGVLLVLRDPVPPAPPIKGQPAAVASNPSEGPEILLSVWDDGRVVALHGHVDLGTGVRTAFAQIVAEELGVDVDQVDMILGDTGTAPNQGPTIASASLQIHARPLRIAAAQARHYLLARAAGVLGTTPDLLQVTRGVVTAGQDGAADSPALTYAQLVSGQNEQLMLDPATPVRDHAHYTVVGQSQPRLDIPAKATGELTFVHDMRLPGMLHGRVVRPPYAGADHGDFVGNLLDSVDESSIAHIPGVRCVVVIRDFIGVVAEREEYAEAAAHALRVHWKDWPGLPDVRDLERALRDNPATPRRLVDEGDVEAALGAAQTPMTRTYVWPYQMHASIGPSCAVAHWREAAPGEPFALTVWAGTQNPHALRMDLARLTGLADVEIEIVRMEASGCYGRNGADDVAADAVLLSRAAGAPVRVQLTRKQENLWEPKGAAQWMQVRGGLNLDGSVAGYDFSTSYPSNGAPTLALLLTRAIEPAAHAFEMGDRTARPPYTYANLRVTVNDMPPILRASWLRGVSALPNSFAHESYVDELASAAGVDPVEFRLRHLDDPWALNLVQATAARAGWQPRTAPGSMGAEGDILHGQGVAYARYVHSKWPGFGAAWAAWVADVDVNRKTGEVHVRRVVVGHDAGLTVNPAGVEHQVHGNVIQTTSRALHERVSTRAEDNAITATEWGSYPILSFRQVPVIEVMQMPRPDEPPLGAGESASVPGTAAIANAIFDATGVRFRQPPFTPEVVRAALNPLAAPGDPVAQTASDPAPVLPALAEAGIGTTAWPRRRRRLWGFGALIAGAAGAVFGLLGMRSPIAPVASPAASTYSEATIERGRQLAALGNCEGCHTIAGGTPYAGGRAIHTPYGEIYTTNLTPDRETGIGAWSLAAFQRAMREGISRDGQHLYPAFPYTAFRHMTDDDLTALYAWLMRLAPVRQPAAQTDLRFPFGYRPAMAVWNALYLGESTALTRPQDSPGSQWSRGAYLVNAVGHCSVCHSPRDVLAGERMGKDFLSGAMVNGWEAPSLAIGSSSPVPWTEQAYFDYLRNGYSAEHGAAGGSMAQVVSHLSGASDADLQAMAHYLASLRPSVSQEVAASSAQALVSRAAATEPALLGPAQRMFSSACGACHHDGDGPKVLGANVPLALSTNLHSDRPDNVIRVILEGVQEPVSDRVGFMKGFSDHFDDRQLADLVRYLRARFAPGKRSWDGLEEKVSEIRRWSNLQLR